MRLAERIAALYALLAVAGVVWIFGAGRFRETLTPAGPGSVARGLAVGGGVAALVVVASLLLRRGSGWVRGMEALLGKTLGPLPTGAVFLLAGSSALGEEIFFRAGLQPTLGLPLASLLFGVLHFPADARLVPWTLFATVMGFALGLLYQECGTLAAPLAAHFGINVVNLWVITRPDAHAEHAS
ncbi:MAG: CPBP family intramembrane metalloprotease [Planctomycetes bacterium]|nr:CPBP family intramembrane metalloprotease [Planctomycetota bacterium]